MSVAFFASPGHVALLLPDWLANALVPSHGYRRIVNKHGRAKINWSLARTAHRRNVRARKAKGARAKILARRS